MAALRFGKTDILVAVFAILQYQEAMSACPFNPCTSVPGICLGMTCAQDITCLVNCVCDNTSTARDCLDEKDTNASDEETGHVTTATVETKTCPADLVCVHGRCEAFPDVGVVCICNEGWSGQNCSETNQRCDLNCTSGMRCALFGRQQLCLPISFKSTTSPPGPLVQRERNVCNTSHYEKPAKSEHECPLPCEHGVCRAVNGSFACECDPGSHGQMCQNKCCRDCGGRGDCYYDSEKSEQLCNCWQNYTGSHCQDVRILVSSVKSEKPATWYRWVAGVSVVVLVVLLTLLVLLPYVLWRHRVLLVMKVLHFFQQYEDDDDRQWDAFVSYKSNTPDEKFVAHTLFPKLERELGFKLHVHFRDFVPGETIADNIIKAILGSRRTILIVSPEFATSEWTKFEYQVAQQEMLKRKHRIIPILLDGVTNYNDNIDPNLKAIIGSVTYLEWPTCGTEKKLEKFWKRLELSMPKKRAPASSTETGVDNKWFNYVNPDTIDVSVVTDKTEKPSVYGISCSEEDYATINEVEMNKTDNDHHGSKHNRRDSGVGMLYSDGDLQELEVSNRILEECENSLNRSRDLEKSKSDILCTDILRGGVKATEV